MKIGLVYIKGSLPGFEDFGNLPTDLVKSNGVVSGTNGLKASKILDGIIIPGGSILESNSISIDLANEIKKLANEGKPVIGICSGFQALANQTDVGRKSPCPIIKEGLGLLDVNFSPLISNDRVEGTIVNDSFLTKNLDKTSYSENITGFHCHTYGKIEINESNALPIFESSIKRMNYSDTKSSVLSGVRNDEGNVIGTLIHGLFDENPTIVENFLDFLGAEHNDIDQIFMKNADIKKKIRSELAIESGINIKNSKLCNEFKKILINSLNSKFNENKDNDCNNNNNNNNNNNYNYNNNNNNNFLNDLNSLKNNIPPMIMIGSTGSDSGKTFITTGLAGAFTKRGLNVAVLKVGPDVRDTEPSLYLTKNKMEEFTSIKIGHLGWMDIENTLKRLKSSDYDFVIVEGVMSVFTGLLNEKIPYSGAEIAISSNIPMILASGVNKGGIESAAIDIVSHAKKLKEMNVNVSGIILNKVYDQDIFDNVANFISTETKIDSDNIISIPKIKLDKRSTTPEVEIKLEEFSKVALKTIEENINLEKIIKIAEIPSFNRYLSFDEIKNFF
ncbi:nucleotide-binding protein [uncultured Methanobrevibacter sp.]|nr:AAA family ATPase [uncultured Methanobrevibacter sp.]